MTLHSGLLMVHLLAATVWTGGHLVLALAVLPQVTAERSVQRLRDFEAGFETIGMPALLLQVVTGGWMAHDLWRLDVPLTRQLIVLKLVLLAVTVVLAVDARLRLIPRLSVQTLPAMARRIRVVTVLSVLFVLVGATFRTGPWW